MLFVDGTWIGGEELHFNVQTLDDCPIMYGESMTDYFNGVASVHNGGKQPNPIPKLTEGKQVN